MTIWVLPLMVYFYQMPILLRQCLWIGFVDLDKYDFSKDWLLLDPEQSIMS